MISTGAAALDDDNFYRDKDRDRTPIAAMRLYAMPPFLSTAMFEIGVGVADAWQAPVVVS